MKKILDAYLLLLCCIILVCSSPAEAVTRVEKVNGEWKLLVDDKPFEVKGVTFGIDFNEENIGKRMRDLKHMGVNTIRTWGVGDQTQLLLDTAHAYGIKVMVGIWMRHGRPGMEGDDSFNYLIDKKGMDDMYDDAIKAVQRYKNHPAVLFWGVGNEVVLNIETDEEKETYAKFLEKVCKSIKKKDPNHPVASVSAWVFSWEWWHKFTPSVDIYGINVYGGGADQIPDEAAKLGIDKPYVICEYGVNGEWEAQPDQNGLLIEPGDRQKYDVIATGYHSWIKNKPNCLGVYVFNYGNGDDHGAVWLSMYFDNARRPAYWATREAFTGKKPEFPLPEIQEFLLPEERKKTGVWVPLKLQVKDAEKNAFDISFHYNQRTGGRARRDQINKLEFRGDIQNGFEVKLPDENGLLKMYVFVKDKHNNISIAQTSYIVDNGKVEKFIPGARVSLPFYVYKDGDKMPYQPTGYMGDFQHLKVDGANKEQVHSGNTSLKISYANSGGWVGLAFVDPPDDWGDRAGGFNLTGATKLTFWAKASSNRVNGTFGFGMIGKNKPYYDTGEKSLKMQLSKEWKKYEIDLSSVKDLRCIKTGFVFYLGGIGEPYDVWIDEVRFE